MEMRQLLCFDESRARRSALNEAAHSVGADAGFADPELSRLHVSRPGYFV